MIRKFRRQDKMASDSHLGMALAVAAAAVALALWAFTGRQKRSTSSSI